MDGSGRAPAGVRLDQLQADDLKLGYKATSVPTTVAVLGHMVRHYGKLAWSDIVAPARAAAQDGYRITQLQHRLQTREQPNFAKVPSGSGARYFLKTPEQAYEAGELFKQPDLALLLDRLAQGGPEDFYQGEVARLIERDMQENSGFLRASDLADIPWPCVRPALRSSYRGLDLVAGPPPAAGRNLFALLKLLESFPSQSLAQGGPKAAWDLAQAMRRVLSERRLNPVDPDAYDWQQDALLGNGPQAGGA